MSGHILALSLGTYGCRVVQKALEVLLPSEQISLSRELQGYVLQCVQDQNANHVIQKVIEHVSPHSSETVRFIPDAFSGSVLRLAAHCYSCRVLQRIFEYCPEAQSRPLIEELHVHAAQLMQDQYGNYVVQWILQKGQPKDSSRIIDLVRGKVLNLSRHKFASNVLEEVVRASDDQTREELMEEILKPLGPSEALAAFSRRPGPPPPISNETTYNNSQPPSDPNSTNSNNGSSISTSTSTLPPTPIIPAATLMMRDQFANYVLQRFLEVAKGQQRMRLVTSLRPQLSGMRRIGGGHAKHLAAIERLLEEGGGPVLPGGERANLNSTSSSQGIPSHSGNQVGYDNSRNSNGNGHRSDGLY